MPKNTATNTQDYEPSDDQISACLPSEGSFISEDAKQMLSLLYVHETLANGFIGSDKLKHFFGKDGARSYSKTLQALESKGYITKTQNYKAGERPNQYRVNVSVLPQELKDFLSLSTWKRETPAIKSKRRSWKKKKRESFRKEAPFRRRSEEWSAKKCGVKIQSIKGPNRRLYTDFHALHKGEDAKVLFKRGAKKVLCLDISSAFFKAWAAYGLRTGRIDRKQAAHIASVNKTGFQSFLLSRGWGLEPLHKCKATLSQLLQWKPDEEMYPLLHMAKLYAGKGNIAAMQKAKSNNGKLFSYHLEGAEQDFINQICALFQAKTGLPSAFFLSKHDALYVTSHFDIWEECFSTVLSNFMRSLGVYDLEGINLFGKEEYLREEKNSLASDSSARNLGLDILTPLPGAILCVRPFSGRRIESLKRGSIPEKPPDKPPQNPYRGSRTLRITLI
ncbi:MAG: hypothetical protein RLP09_02640 [Sandaracinaceae bacterium]